MTRAWLWMLSAVLLSGASLGCTGDDDGGAEEEDAGPREWMGTDAGIPPRRDAGPPAEDAGLRICYELPRLTEAELPRCRAATADCVDACPEGDAGEDCRSACWANDPTPASGDVACQDCVFRQLLGCVEDAGCEAEVAAWLCCIIDNCSSSTDPCCTERECAALAEPMFICGYTNQPSCFELTSGEIGECYAESDPDAGVPDDAGVGGDAGMPDAGMPVDCSE